MTRSPSRARVRVVNRRRGGWWWRVPSVLLCWGVVATPFLLAIVGWVALRAWGRDLPEVPDLAAWRAGAGTTSRMLAVDGTVLAELPFRDGAAVGYRTLIDAEALPPVMVNAILAAEDARFFTHDGVDLRAMARAAWANWRAGRVVEGASTITQQVARNLLPEEIGTERSARRKVREALLARKLERSWSKRDILGVYGSLVFLGGNAYGFAAAARAYFDCELDDLSVAQAALLAGLIQAPSALDPRRNPVGAKRRRDEVLTRMRRHGFVDEATVRAALAEPLALRLHVNPYGRIAGWHTEFARRRLLEVMPEEVDAGGLQIWTTAQPALEASLREAAAKALPRLGDRATRADAQAELATLVIDHRLGTSDALLGGTDFGAGNQFDRVNQSCRQPGSAWKPLVYLAGLADGSLTAGTALRDAPIAEYDEVLDVHWKPRSGNRFRGVVLAQDALASSLNASAIDALDRVGADAVIGLARRLGITTRIRDVRPMALGASCVTPFELARAYAVIARGGWAITPRAIVAVAHDGALLFDARVPEDPWLDPRSRLDRLVAVAGAAPDLRTSAGDGSPLVDPRDAFVLRAMLTDVVRRGTATLARGLGRPVAGKTGTTNDNTDAWFVGFTARATISVWLGFDDPARTLGPQQDGAKAALPLWIDLVRAAERDRPPGDVPGPPPPGVEQVVIDPETGLRAAPRAGGRALWFREGTAPIEQAGQPSTRAGEFERSAREF